METDPSFSDGEGEMTVAAGLRPNHYSTLGLRPDARAEDIERAFRNALSPFQPQVLGGVAAASAAYAVLSDPARRRAYDLANGFARPPAPPPSAQASAPAGWAITGPNVMRAVPRPAGAPAPAAPPFVAAPKCETADAAVPPPLAEAVAPAQPAEPALTVTPPTPLRAPRAPDLAGNSPRPAPVILGMDGVEDGAIGARKGLMVLGAVAAVALAGGSLGWVAGSDADEANASGLETPLPKAEPRQLSIITPTEEIAAAPAEPQRRVARLASAPRPAPLVAPTSAPAAAPASDGAEAAIAAETPVDSLAPVAETGAPAADLPLPPRTIARTIDRIGYSCGSVTGSESSGSGVFTISCSSGQKFRASPRSGRYRFKRIG